MESRIRLAASDLTSESLLLCDMGRGEGRIFKFMGSPRRSMERVVTKSLPGPCIFYRHAIATLSSMNQRKKLENQVLDQI